MAFDAAVGSRAVLGRGIEWEDLGMPTGDMEFVNFISADLSRNAKYNPSTAITGSGGMDRGTPGENTAEKKLKYDLTCSRFLYDMAIMFGKPTAVLDLGAGRVSSVTVTAPGSGYVTAVVTFSAPPGGGIRATGTVTQTADAVTSVTITNGGSGYVTAPTVTFTDTGGPGTGATGTAALLPAGSSGILRADITDGGTGYSAATVVFDAPAGEGTTATGTVTVDVATGKVTAIVITDPGSGYDHGSLPAATISGDGTLATAVVVLYPAGPWLVKIRPTVNEIRSGMFYFSDGGDPESLPPWVQTGRRCAEYSIGHSPDKRAEADVTYTEPTGDTISGFPLAKTGNSGSLGTGIKKAITRGRRYNDADFLAGKSVYVKVTGTPGTDSVDLLAKIDDASPGDGTSFPGGSYGTTGFTVNVPSSFSDGYSPIIDSNSGYMIGIGAENMEPLELTFGSQDLSVMVAGDEFEIPAVIVPLTKVVNPENRLSEFHFLRRIDLDGTVNGRDIRIDSGTVKVDRPYKPYYANGKKWPFTIDPTGDVKFTVNFKKRLVDRYFRIREDEMASFSCFDVYQVASGVAGAPVPTYEKIEFYAAQMQVSTMKSGDVSTKNALDETITLEAFQPETTPSSIPAGFEGENPIEINVTTTIDPLWLFEG